MTLTLKPRLCSPFPFPGCAADKSSDMTLMWPDLLDCDMSPAGCESWKALGRPGPVHIMSYSPDTISQLRNPAGGLKWQTCVLLPFRPPPLLKHGSLVTFPHCYRWTHQSDGERAFSVPNEIFFAQVLIPSAGDSSIWLPLIDAQQGLSSEMAQLWLSFTV